MARRLWVGLDVGVETTSICVIDAGGVVLHETVCPTNAKYVHREIVSLGCRRSGTVGLESGTGIGLARDLRNLGYTVEIYEARQLSKFLRVRRNKTDAGDALGIPERQVEGDLKRFKEFIESRGTETGAWRGEVDQSKV